MRKPSACSIASCRRRNVVASCRRRNVVESVALRVAMLPVMVDPNEPDAASQAGFSWARRAASFRYAFAGMAHLARSQHNAWIHLLFTLAVLGLGVLFPLSALEWCAIAIAIALVWIAEAFNTALELLADATQRDHDPLVGRAKDVAAGAVLIAALAAAVVGLVIFAPQVVAFLGF